MGHLAFVGSHGVDHLADDADALLANDGFPFVPDDGARQSELTRHALIGRRWLLQANPGLSGLITEAIGDRWTTDLSQLRELVTFVDDVGFHDRWCTVKKANKERLADELVRRYRRRGERLTIPTDALFDCHVAAVSMEQRQLLNLLHVLTLYQRIKDQPRASHTPRVVLFAGSAAPGDLQAQQLLRLIHAVGQVVNHDEQVGERLKVVVLAEPRGALAGRIVAAADVFEQIALAGTGAAGRGRMEFPLNGARTVGTMDGANRALADALGRDHLFLFGLSADEARELRRDYSPALFVAQSEELKGVLDRVGSGAFSPHEPALFRPIVDDLLTRDASLTLADYDACVTAQEVAAAAFGELALWTRTAIWTVAHAGGFSADRTVATSARDRWRLQPVRSR
jgi:starch phosphorylase